LDAIVVPEVTDLTHKPLRLERSVKSRSIGIHSIFATVIVAGIEAGNRLRSKVSTCCPETLYLPDAFRDPALTEQRSES
jgi:hypothetical protein